MKPNYNSFIAIILLFSFAFKCKESNKSIIYISKPIDSSNFITQNIQLVSISELIRNSSIYENKKIAVSGKLAYGIEWSAIYEKKLDFENRRTEKAIWLEFDNELYNTATGENLFTNSEEVKKIANKNIVVIGNFTTGNKGHLNNYGGSIQSIRYIKLE